MYCIVQLDGVKSIVWSDVPCTVWLDDVHYTLYSKAKMNDLVYTTVKS